MKPLTSLLNFTPTSIALASPAFGAAGPTDGGHKLVHGQLPTTIETVTPGPAPSMLPLSSIARLRIVTGPTAPGDQSKLQVDVPCAGRHLAPPSTDTSTPATNPPVSVAVPVIVTRLPLWTCPPAAGDVMPAVGAKMPEDRLGATRGLRG